MRREINNHFYGQKRHIYILKEKTNLVKDLRVLFFLFAEKTGLFMKNFKEAIKMIIGSVMSIAFAAIMVSAFVRIDRLMDTEREEGL